MNHEDIFHREDTKARGWFWGSIGKREVPVF
jgi:hypothetical protein